MVDMRAPAGWMIVFVGSWMSASVDGALVFSSDTFAAESTSPVVFKSGGFEQPEFDKILFAKSLLTLSSIISPSAGSQRHFFQF